MCSSSSLPPLRLLSPSPPHSRTRCRTRSACPGGGALAIHPVVIVVSAPMAGYQKKLSRFMYISTAGHVLASTWPSDLTQNAVLAQMTAINKHEDVVPIIAPCDLQQQSDLSETPLKIKAVARLRVAYVASVESIPSKNSPSNGPPATPFIVASMATTQAICRKECPRNHRPGKTACVLTDDLSSPLAN